jgi:hypothetical protein
VATREHQEFAGAMGMIDLAPPGLYEAVITDVGEDTANPELIRGRYLFRLERRSLDDIRAFGNNDPEDDLRFATAARVSDVNLALYRATLGPVVRMMATKQSAEMMRALHPARLGYNIFSDNNPAMLPVRDLAERIRAERRPVPADNMLLAVEKTVSDWIVRWLETAGSVRDALEEHAFLTIYGNPLLQAMVGFRAGAEATLRRADRDVVREAMEAHRQAELETKFAAGGLAEAIVRALIYVRLPDRSIDERGFNVAKALCDAQAQGARLSQARLKDVFRDQFLLLTMDEERAVATLPDLLPADPAACRLALADIRKVLDASGSLSEEASGRLARIAAIFEAGAAAADAPAAPQPGAAKAVPAVPAAVPARVPMATRRAPARNPAAKAPVAKQAAGSKDRSDA